MLMKSSRNPQAGFWQPSYYVGFSGKGSDHPWGRATKIGYIDVKVGGKKAHGSPAHVTANWIFFFFACFGFTCGVNLLYERVRMDREVCSPGESSRSLRKIPRFFSLGVKDFLKEALNFKNCWKMQKSIRFFCIQRQTIKKSQWTHYRTGQ